jgi:dTDP-4-amino-4,6-dideoxygalactose transaminase
MFSKHIQASHAFSFWKGRVALYAILKALQIQQGDEVILPGFTCVVVPNAVRFTGATPVYVDIDPVSYNIDPIAVKQSISSRTRAIIVQHTFGIPADLQQLIEIASERGLPIIEDCAHALGSRYMNRLVGTFGVGAFFSSQWSKPYTTGLGGMAVTSDAQLAKALNKLQSEFTAPPQRQVLRLYLQYRLYDMMFGPRLYWPSMRVLRGLSKLNVFVGSSSQEELDGILPSDVEWNMSSFQAKIGRMKLYRLSQDLIHNRTITQLYEEILSKNGWSVVERPKHGEPVFLRYPVRVTNKWNLLERAKGARIELGSWFESVLHPIRTSLERYGYHGGQCPVAERSANEVVNLPLHPRITSKEAKRIVEFVCNTAENPT